MTDEPSSGSTGAHAEDGQVGDDDSTTVRELLEEIGVDPADLESVDDLQDVVELDLSTEGETVDPDDVDLADVLDAPVTVEENQTPAGVVRQSTQDYPPDWDRRRRQVYARDDHQCQNCRRRGGPYGDVELHAHHIVPKSRGGVHRLENLVTVCKSCHDAVHSRNAVAPTAITDAEAEPSTLAEVLAGIKSAKTAFRRWKRMYRKVSRFGP
ncbi:HNH endonuclease [Natronorubrum sp. JWXQ-INN-674]|uniref:HNH endonuclease n=2 Tax=Natrialbaceae TaxID=1644061 RepID=A0A4S3TJQ5_9EURY|nr:MULTISPECIES: HNH endonuclease signature motif containing protein [Natrialbaceae]MXV61603.1 HNH endonuclease [Natronorubrum halalkaliphilum]THE63115.1 HNH endonuclease [Salinadaptatus halalkaliphilus]